VKGKQCVCTDTNMHALVSVTNKKWGGLTIICVVGKEKESKTNENEICFEKNGEIILQCSKNSNKSTSSEFNKNDSHIIVGNIRNM